MNAPIPEFHGPADGLREVRALVVAVLACRERSAATELIDLSQMHMEAAAEHAARIVDLLAGMERQGRMHEIEQFLIATYGG